MRWRRELEDAGEQAEGEEVLALLARGAAEGLDGEGGDGDADFDEAVVVHVGRDLVGVVEQDAAFAEKADVLVVAVLVEGDQEVRLVSGGEHLARADAHLEDGGASRNGRRDGHVGHDLLGAATGEAGEKAADGLDAVLGIAGEADDRVADLLFFGASRGGGVGSHGFKGQV